MEFKTELTKNVFKSKYLLPNEKEPDEAVSRIVKIVKKYYPDSSKKIEEYIHNKWLLPAGGLWRAAMNPDKNVSAINCTTLPSPDDSLESIFDSYYWWAKYAAFGQGEGIDLSKLRPRGSLVHNSSHQSTGAVSFMHIYDSILKTIAQEGRRGASLISLSISHPDIPEFIFVKDEENILENANISIQVTDEFMKLLSNKNSIWTFTFKNKYETIEKKIGAIELFDMICSHAWKSGDPGLQFIDTARKESNSDVLGYPIISTNACSEQWLDANHVCLLSSINIGALDNKGILQPYSYSEMDNIVEHGIIMLDAFRKYEYDEGRSPNDEQKRKLKEFPRIGLGITGLADFFIGQEITYGTDDSIKKASNIFKNLVKISYITSYNIAKSNKESFPVYDKNKYMKSSFVRRLLDENIINDTYLDYQAHVCKNTVAPNGTVTEVAEVGGGGIEPIFSKYFVRRERSTTGKFKEWFIYNNAVKNYCDYKNIELTKENVDKLIDPFWVTAHTVDNNKKVKLMSEIQKWIDSSISVTYNLPKTATVEDVKNVYYSAWKNNLKGVTVFREGSKKGILITEDNYNESLTEKTMANKFSTIRPETLKCDIYIKNVNKEKHIILVGLIDGRLYEIFVTNDPEDKINLEENKHGFITKISKGRYDLQIENGEEKTILKDISKVFDKEYGSLSRMLSMSLRHRVPIQFIVDQLSKDKQFDSFEKAVMRTLKNYIQEGEEVKTSEVCPVCGSQLYYQSGCKTCINETCNWSKCD